MALLLSSPSSLEGTFKDKTALLELKTDSNSTSSDLENAEIDTETSNHTQESPAKSLEASTVKQGSDKEYNSQDTEKISGEKLREFIENNYRKNNDGTLEMINVEQLAMQKKVLGFLLKQFGTALFSGKSIMSVSLPVSIFEAQSHLEREARSLSYAPYFLEKGGNTSDSLEQFKFAIAQFISSLHLGTNPQKPFNPILGETFQGKLGDCAVYLEQISHHPPISAVQLFGKNFTLEGNVEFTANVSMNSVKSQKIGYFTVAYKNTRTVIKAQYPASLMSGTSMGKRTFQFTDKLYIFDVENKYYAEIKFGSEKSGFFKKKAKSGDDQFSGAIWKINDTFAEKLKQCCKMVCDIRDTKFKEKDHATAKLEDIEGSWLESLKIGEQTYWSFGTILPYKLVYERDPLPSDSTNRFDILHLKGENETESQKHKEALEEIQRNDKRLREQSKKKETK